MAVFYIILVCVGVKKHDLSPFNTDGNVQLKLNVQPQEPKSMFYYNSTYYRDFNQKPSTFKILHLGPRFLDFFLFVFFKCI